MLTTDCLNGLKVLTLPPWILELGSDISLLKVNESVTARGLCDGEWLLSAANGEIRSKMESSLA